jgi:hypothetical protein
MYILGEVSRHRHIKARPLSAGKRSMGRAKAVCEISGL